MRVVICDFDGTLIKGNLENFFLRYLLSETSYKWRILMVSFFTFPLNILLNRLYRPSVFKSWTFVLRNSKDKIIQQFLSSSFFLQSESMRLRTDVLDHIKSIHADRFVILTGSDEDLVRAFISNRINQIQINDVVGSQVKTDFFRVNRHPFGKGKCKYVNKNSYNIGIANDYSDHFYMDMCNEQYYV